MEEKNEKLQWQKPVVQWLDIAKTQGGTDTVPDEGPWINQETGAVLIGPGS